MAFINAKLDDSVKEGEIVPEGEYDLRIVKASRKETKKGDREMTVVVIKIDDPEYPDAPPIMQYLVDSKSGDDSDQVRMRSVELKRFLQAFGVAMQADGYDDEDLPGATAKCMVVQEEGDDKVIRNRIRLPRLRE